MTTPTRKPDVRIQAMSARTLVAFHGDGTQSTIWAQMDGKVGGSIDRPGRLRWDPTDTRPRRGARLWPAGSYFRCLYAGSPEEYAIWGAWLPDSEPA